MIRWSWVETHTGVFGSQVANSLAKKNTQMSSMKLEIHWWNSDINQPTIPQSSADESLKKHLETKIGQKNKHSLSYCRCSAQIINHFVRNAKTNREQQNTLVNTIREGMELEIFWPDSMKKGWHKSKASSI